MMYTEITQHEYTRVILLQLTEINKVVSNTRTGNIPGIDGFFFGISKILKKKKKY